MTPSDTAHPSYTLGLRAVPYAVPATVGIACLSWGIADFVAKTTEFWVLAELGASLLAMLTGAGLLLFSAVGALALAVGRPVGRR